MSPDRRSQTERLVIRSRIGVPVDELFAWFQRPGAFERLTPPWERMRVVERTGTIRDGDTAVLRIGKGPLHFRWVAVHRDFVPGRRFVDVQTRGPMAKWVHTHLFEPDGQAAVMQDRIDYRLPLEPASRLVAGRSVATMLRRQFRYRHRIVAADLARHRGVAPQRFVMTGATGLIGGALSAFLTTGGHEVRILRHGPDFDPGSGLIRSEVFEDADVVIHLAGAPIGDGRWTSERRRAIMRSRSDGTGLVAEAIAGCTRRPRTLVSASAIGYYGDRGDQELHEDAGSGDTFLSEVCRVWEAAADPAREAGVRVVHPRIGIVLTPAGGALAKLLRPFLLGLGGRAGSGRQWWSWITADDLVYAFHHLALKSGLHGPVNLVAPQPVRQREFAATLARVLHRPCFAPLPAPVIRAALGELGERLLLDSAKVRSDLLASDGFDFEHPTLKPGLEAMLGRDPGAAQA